MRGLHDRFRQCRRNQRRAVRRREQVLLFEALESRFLLTATADDSRPVGGVTVDPLAHSSSSLIVQFRPGASAPGSLSAYQAMQTVDPAWALTPGMHKVEINAISDYQSALAAFSQDPNVAFVEPDYRIQLQADQLPAVTPNDPDFNQTWGLNNVGQTGGTPGADIHAPGAWAETTGSTTTIVAVIDTGVDYNHPDLYEIFGSIRRKFPPAANRT